MALDPNTYTPPAITSFNGTVNRARVGGSGFTVFTWQNQPITLARQISHQSAMPVGPGTTPIHPLDSPYPVELITPMALTMGTLVLELYEVYGANVWERLVALGGAATGHGTAPAQAGTGSPVDLAGVFQYVANSTNPIKIFRVIRPPKIRGKKMSPYTQEFHNCVVSSLNNGETIEVGTMEVLKQITVNYTYLTQGGVNTVLGSSTTLGANPPGSKFV